jgi:DNA-binding NtrC family response regulator
MCSIPTILFADSSASEQASCLQVLKEFAPHNLIVSSSHEETTQALTNNEVNVLFLDLSLFPKNSYMSALDAIQEKSPNTLIIIAIPDGDQNLEQQILSRDHFFYVTIPYEKAQIELALKRALAKLNLQPPMPPTPKKRLPAFYGIIGETVLMQDLFSLIRKVAEDDFANVLIRGESGTGKELVAKAIHLHSTRNKKNFVPVNCAAIPDDLLESELFGYTKGAFTGATHNKIGRIEYADGGTLFLDEIGDMKPSLQAKLLRVLQEREFEAVGSLKATPVDTRIVAATHCNLEELVSQGTFREDLYYRLSVIPLIIPPLRERREDIPILLETFLDLHASSRGRERFIIPLTVMSALLSYQWKGNVRELENLVQQMSILYSGKEIQLDDLPPRLLMDFDPATVDFDKTKEMLEGISLVKQEPRKTHNGGHSSFLPSNDELQEGQVDFKELINDYEAQLILKAMKITGGNKKEAAKMLNLKRTTLLEKIKKKDLQGMWEEI